MGVLWAPRAKKSHKIPQIFQKSHPTLWVFKVPQIRVPRVGLSLSREAKGETSWLSARSQQQQEKKERGKRKGRKGKKKKERRRKKERGGNYNS